MKALLAFFLCLFVTASIAFAQTPPVLLYSNPVPGTNYPIAVTLPPAIWGHGTVIASIDGDTMALGGTIMSSIGSWNLEAGNFTVGLNPLGASGLHIYQVGPGIQTSGSASLIAGKQYTIASTINGVHLSLYVCSPLCIKTYTIDTKPLALGTAAYIGGSGSGIRTCSTCHIWGVKVLTPLTDQQVQAYALASSRRSWKTLWFRISLTRGTTRSSQRCKVTEKRTARMATRLIARALLIPQLPTGKSLRSAT